MSDHGVNLEAFIDVMFTLADQAYEASCRADDKEIFFYLSGKSKAYRTAASALRDALALQNGDEIS